MLTRVVVLLHKRKSANAGETYATPQTKIASAMAPRNISHTKTCWIGLPTTSNLITLGTRRHSRRMPRWPQDGGFDLNSQVKSTHGKRVARQTMRGGFCLAFTAGFLSSPSQRGTSISSDCASVELPEQKNS